MNEKQGINALSLSRERREAVYGRFAFQFPNVAQQPQHTLPLISITVWQRLHEQHQKLITDGKVRSLFHHHTPTFLRIFLMDSRETSRKVVKAKSLIGSQWKTKSLAWFLFLIKWMNRSALSKHQKQNSKLCYNDELYRITSHHPGGVHDESGKAHIVTNLYRIAVWQATNGCFLHLLVCEACEWVQVPSRMATFPSIPSETVLFWSIHLYPRVVLLQA